MSQRNALAFSRLFGITLRLHYRNRLALLYGHVFPAIILLAFLGLYSQERPLLIRHLGQLLAVTALSGACFALPTTLVGERERGVWRRFSLAPVPLWALAGPTLVARFCLLCLAGAVQLALSLAVGMPMPAHPFHLALAFAVAAFAFLALGLVLSMLADTAYGAQALGQCVFLPMLVLGGVAVPVEALPEWARALSAYLPGRYAVEAMQACATGQGLGAVGFQLFGLSLSGLAAVAAGMSMFRWDAGGARLSPGARARTAAALAAWMLVGYLATARGSHAGEDARSARRSGSRSPAAEGGAPVGKGPGPTPRTTAGAAPGAAGAAPPPAVRDGLGAGPPAAAVPAAGGETRLRELDGDIDYSTLPPDDGLVSPMARAGDEPPAELSSDLECMRMMIPGWGPGRVADPVQRVRNYLYVAAVPDVYQTGDLERWIPLVVEERLREEFGAEELARALLQIATHPADGDLAPAGQLRGVCFDRAAPADTVLLRERVTFYALKLLGRTTGRIPSP